MTLGVFDLSRIWKRKASFAEVASMVLAPLAMWTVKQKVHLRGRSFSRLKTHASFILWFLVGSSTFITMEEE